MPCPVVSGYLSGIGLIIISQIRKLLWVPRDTRFWGAPVSPNQWQRRP